MDDYITKLFNVDVEDVNNSLRSDGCFSKTIHIDIVLKLSITAKGALPHDIGKIGISDNILRRPRELTAEEWSEVRKHLQMGFGILAGVRSLEDSAEIVLTHQVRFDGSGYPRGLRGVFPAIHKSHWEKIRGHSL